MGSGGVGVGVGGREMKWGGLRGRQKNLLGQGTQSGQPSISVVVGAGTDSLITHTHCCEHADHGVPNWGTRSYRQPVGAVANSSSCHAARSGGPMKCLQSGRSPWGLCERVNTSQYSDPSASAECRPGRCCPRVGASEILWRSCHGVLYYPPSPPVISPKTWPIWLGRG